MFKINDPVRFYWSLNKLNSKNGLWKHLLKKSLSWNQKTLVEEECSHNKLMRLIVWLLIWLLQILRNGSRIWLCCCRLSPIVDFIDGIAQLRFLNQHFTESKRFGFYMTANCLSFGNFYFARYYEVQTTYLLSFPTHQRCEIVFHTNLDHFSWLKRILDLGCLV